VCFFRLLQLVLQTLRNTLLQHLPKPPHAMLHRSHAQLNLYMPPPVPDEKVDGHPSFTSSSHDNPGSWSHMSHSPVFVHSSASRLSALLWVYPPNRSTSSESHIVAVDILQRLVTTKRTIPVAGIPFNGTIASRPMNVELLKDWSSTRQASRKESARRSNYVQDVVKLHSKHG